MYIQIRKFCLGHFSLILSALLLILFVAGGATAATSNTGATLNQVADFDGDGKSDISVFRPSDGMWHILKSSGGSLSVKWGLSSDTIVPGDYDGDGKTDLAVYRIGELSPSSGFANNNWYILRSSDNAFLTKQWGKRSFFSWTVPEQADYDGDSLTDVAVYTMEDYLPARGNFSISQSLNDATITKQWGFNTDRRVPADYDGDGRADLAVYRDDEYLFGDQAGTWFILQSSNNQMRTVQFGLPTDTLVPADYDGDGKADIAVFRGGFWYRINSTDGTFSAVQFGFSDDKPVPADYDGDKKTDIAVFRASTATWYLQRSTEGFLAQPWGLPNDVPVPNAFVR